MTHQVYFHKYGKIKILDQIKQRHPVHNILTKDPNRKLMIKFKYGNLTDLQQLQFHENIKKLIYKVMHSNNVMMDWDDVYQQIWKKIIKSKHTWNQSKGTMVSTWITIVANSVINTLRQNVNKYNSRYCLYDDFYFSSEESGEEGGDKEKMDFVQFLNDDSNLYDKSFEKNIWNEKYADFLNSLNESEHLFMKAVQDMDTQYYYDVNKFKVSNTYLKSKLGYDDSTYYMIINNIKKKYYQAFELSLNKEEHDSYKNKSNNELIF